MIWIKGSEAGRNALPDWADAVALLREETAHPLQVIDEEPRRQCSADGEYNQIGCMADHASPLLKDVRTPFQIVRICFDL